MNNTYNYKSFCDLNSTTARLNRYDDTINYNQTNVLLDLYQSKHNSDGWLSRKIIAIPMAIMSGLIKTMYHIGLKIILSISAEKYSSTHYKTFSEDKKTSLNFSIHRDLQESFGWLKTLFNDKAGQFTVFESRKNKEIYNEIIKEKNQEAILFQEADQALINNNLSEAELKIDKITISLNNKDKCLFNIYEKHFELGDFYKAFSVIQKFSDINPLTKDYQKMIICSKFFGLGDLDGVLKVIPTFSETFNKNGIVNSVLEESVKNKNSNDHLEILLGVLRKIKENGEKNDYLMETIIKYITNHIINNVITRLSDEDTLNKTFQLIFSIRNDKEKLELYEGVFHKLIEGENNPRNILEKLSPIHDRLRNVFNHNEPILEFIIRQTNLNIDNSTDNETLTKTFTLINKLKNNALKKHFYKIVALNSISQLKLEEKLDKLLFIFDSIQKNSSKELDTFFKEIVTESGVEKNIIDEISSSSSEIMLNKVAELIGKLPKSNKKTLY